MFDDILVDKIDTSQLQNENKTLGKGGFGKVEKMKYLKVMYVVNRVCLYAC